MDKTSHLTTLVHEIAVPSHPSAADEVLADQNMSCVVGDLA